MPNKASTDTNSVSSRRAPGLAKRLRRSCGITLSWWTHVVPSSHRRPLGHDPECGLRASRGVTRKRREALLFASPLDGVYVAIMRAEIDHTANDSGRSPYQIAYGKAPGHLTALPFYGIQATVAGPNV